MNNEYSNFFKIIDNKLIVNVPYMKVYIPEDYFQHAISEINGEEVTTIGIFLFDVYGADSKKFDESDPFKRPQRYFFKVPVTVTLCPSDISETRDENGHITSVLEFTQGDIFFKTVMVTKEWKTVNKLMKLLLNGFLPKELPYDEIVSIINESCAMNGMSLNVADTVLEILVASLTRDKNDMSKPFRYTIRDNPNVKMTDKKNIKIDTLARITNSFAGISSGDPKQAITVAISREKTKEPQKESAIEESLRNV